MRKRHRDKRMVRRTLLGVTVLLCGTAAVTWYGWLESEKKTNLAEVSRNGLIPDYCFKGSAGTGTDFENPPDGNARFEPYGMIASGTSREYVPAGIIQIAHKKALPTLERAFSLPSLG